MVVKIKNTSDNALPNYETALAAGMDLRADFSKVSSANPIKFYGSGEIIFRNNLNDDVLLRLDPGARALIPTGLFLAIPEGYELQIRPRSGLALKSGLTVLNAPGTIDADYRQEIGIIIINHSHETQWIVHKERVAQGVLAKVEKIEWVEVSDINDGIDRGGGFGHSGKL